MSDTKSPFDSENIEGLAGGLDAHVLTIRLDRPGKRNAITYDMYVAITAMLDRAAADDAVRCVIITGSGSIFTAGHDVAGFARGLSMAVEDKPSFSFMTALSQFPKPVIAALNGDAVGIGATMLLHCDLVYAVPEATLIFPFMTMGLIPEFASTFYLPRMIGHRRAMELFLRQGRCTPHDALGWGLVNRIVPGDALMDVVDQAAREVAELSPDAVRETKRLAKAHDRQAVSEAIADEAHCFHRLLDTDFVRERLGAIRHDISRKR